MAFQFTDSNVKEIIAQGKPVVIDFWATWCGPCRAIAPFVDELAAEYEGKVTIGKYNIDDENDLAVDFRVRSIPTILFFNHGENVPSLRMVGAHSKEQIKDHIEQLLAL